jgi:hypothetical protein
VKKKDECRSVFPTNKPSIVLAMASFFFVCLIFLSVALEPLCCDLQVVGHLVDAQALGTDEPGGDRPRDEHAELGRHLGQVLGRLPVVDVVLPEGRRVGVAPGDEHEDGVGRQERGVGHGDPLAAHLDGEQEEGLEGCLLYTSDAADD